MKSGALVFTWFSRGLENRTPVLTFASTRLLSAQQWTMAVVYKQRLKGFGLRRGRQVAFDGARGVAGFSCQAISPARKVC